MIVAERGVFTTRRCGSTLVLSTGTIRMIKRASTVVRRNGDDKRVKGSL
jgi:hypothetical protein